MNIGIIGCGAISDQYMIGLNKNKEILKVVACADLDSNKSEVFSKKHKIDILSVEEIFVNNDTVDNKLFWIILFSSYFIIIFHFIILFMIE